VNKHEDSDKLPEDCSNNYGESRRANEPEYILQPLRQRCNGWRHREEHWVPTAEGSTVCTRLDSWEQQV